MTFINPTGLAGSVAEPAEAVEAELKFNKLMKNCCHARDGRLVVPSKNGVCGYGFTCCVLESPEVAISFLPLVL